MVVFSKSEFKVLKERFDREYKRVEPYINRRPLTDNLQLRAEYKVLLVETYNAIINYVLQCEPELSLEGKIAIRTDVNGFLNKIKDCFTALELNYQFDKNILAEIDISDITEVLHPNPIEENQSSSDSEDTENPINEISNNSLAQSKQNTPKMSHKISFL